MDSVEIGSRVTLKDVATQAIISVELAMAADFNSGVPKISMKSPLGSTLLGRHVGDELTVQTPSGEIQFRILSVEGLGASQSVSQQKEAYHE